MQPPVLSLDIGNTRTGVGIIDPGEATCRARVDIPTAAIASMLVSAVDSLLESVGISGPVPCKACTVVKGVFDSVHGLGPGRVLSIGWVGARSGLPVDIGYESPRTLGPDRIANALCARHMAQERAAIIVDAGTAIKVDLLTDTGEFAGGAIMPGIRMQSAALAQGTSLLPDIDTQTADIQYPGRSTAQSIGAGIVLGSAAAVSGLVARGQQIFPHALVLTTGGAWESLAEYVNFEYRCVPDLTLIGTALF